MTEQKKSFTIAGVGDIHIGQHNTGFYKPIFEEISEKADVLVLSGDLTDHGYIEEAHLLLQELSHCKVPVVGVLGNHDYDQNHEDQIKEILNSDDNVHILDGEYFIHNDVGFAGVKGFAGGFEKYMLGSFGEQQMKDFVHFGVEEALKLERALSLLENEVKSGKKVAITHYSPIRNTVIGEAEDIFPFLGSSRLAEPIDLFNVSVVFHGHAHHGTYEGKTLKGIPVYNVSYTIMEKRNKKSPYALITI